MSPPCILIVDADVLVRHPLAEYLRSCGYRVIEAASHAEARLVIDSAASLVDLVFADVDGHGESGFTLATWMRANHPGIKVVLVGTTVAAAEKVGELCESGPALSKPYDPQLVLDEIRRLLAGRGHGDLAR